MSQSGEGARKSRRALPTILVVVASIIALLSAFAIWGKRQLLETDTWVDTSVELLQDEAIQDALSNFLVDTLYDNVDVEAEISAQLPPQLQPLAGPLSGGLRQVATRAAERLLAEPKIQDLWENANRIAHEKLIAVVENKTTAVGTEDGTVTLDLKAILDELVTQLGLPSDITSKLPPGAASIEILKSDELGAAQTGVNILQTLAWALLAISILLWAAAIWLAGERRRQTLRAVGIAFIVVGALVLVGHRIAGDAVVASLSDVASSETAVDHTWTIATSQLTDIAEAAVLYGILIVLAAWLAGPTRLATGIRDGIAPWYRQARFAYGAAVVFLILLFWWDPTPGTHRLVPSLLLIALVLIGTEFLRREIIREFPDRVASGSAAGIAQTIAAHMREGREKAQAAWADHRAARGGGEDAGDARLAELERLAKLHESNVLTDEEFAAEKQRLLAKSA